MSNKTYTFLFVSKYPCYNLRELAKLLPRDVELSDGDLTYYWSTSCSSLGTSINRAKRRLDYLNEKASIDWQIDDEIVVEHESRTKTVYWSDPEV
jgi:hypothetical protein